MSYTIERGKRVLELVTDDQRFNPCHGNTLVFAMAASCNNVSPRHYDWNVFATGHHRDWEGNILVPDEVWDLGRAADGGCIKPYGKDVSGLGYVKAWKAAVSKRISIVGWTPRVSIWVGGGFGDESKVQAQAINEQGAVLFGGDTKYLKDTYSVPLYEAFKRLFTRPLRGTGSEQEYVNTHEQLLDAVFLYQHRKQLPFSFYLTDSENAAFFQRQTAPVFEEVA